jgi:hypothetical protein
LCE